MTRDFDSVKEPLVSIIIPTLNNDDTIKTCLSSIKNQTYENIETIVVDGLSEDNTVNICKSFDVQVYQKDMNRSAARSFGAQKASGEYLLHLDSDMQIGPIVVDECVCEIKAGVDALVIPETNLGSKLGSQAFAFQKRYLELSRRGYARFMTSKSYCEIGGHQPDLVSGEDKYVHDKLEASGHKIGFSKHRIIHHTGSYSVYAALRDQLEYDKTTQKMKQSLGEDYQEEDADLRLLLKELATNPFDGFAFLLLTISSAVARKSGVADLV